MTGQKVFRRCVVNVSELQHDSDKQFSSQNRVHICRKMDTTRSERRNGCGDLQALEMSEGIGCTCEAWLGNESSCDSRDSSLPWSFSDSKRTWTAFHLETSFIVRIKFNAISCWPVWILLCVFSELDVEKAFLHFSQTFGFSPVGIWIFIAASNPINSI